LYFVDQGSFAQRITAPPHGGAVRVGETRHVLHVAENPIHGSNGLNDRLRTFFKDNPTWTWHGS
jgi:hypothetical protein